MAEDRFVIIGNGPAANEAASTLRQKAQDIRLTMLSRDLTGYHRPMFLPDFVAGKISEDELYINPPDYYSEQGIKLRLGQEVVAADFSKRELMLAHKEVVRFTGLIIATGGKPRIPEPLQDFEDLMMTLKTVADAKAWIERLSRTDSVLIVGGDLTSLMFTKALLSLGKRVAFIPDEESFWPVPLSPSVRDDVAHKLTVAGVEVVPCKKVKGMSETTKGAIEVTTDCGAVRADIVGAFFGLVPDVKFLAGTGLHIERGLLVDEHLKTRFDGVYAAGDCAQVYHPELRDYWVSIGCDNARELGRIAALNLVGEAVEARVSGTKIFDVEGIKVNTSWWAEF